MDPATDATDSLMMAPSRVYREAMYRSDGTESQWINQRFEILVRPGQQLTTSLRAGDMILRVALGHLGAGECLAITEAPLTRQRANGPNGPPGWYTIAVDAAAEAPPGPCRILDSSRRMLPGQLLLRSRATGREAGSLEHDFDEFGDEVRTPVPVDAAAAVPLFEPDERVKVLLPLLSERESAQAVTWTNGAYPSTSGISVDELRRALTNYVDATAVQAAIEEQNKRAPGSGLDASTAATDAVLVECVHQFQRKCYTDPENHDGRAGESTLDSLGLIARIGRGMHAADQGNAQAHQRLRERDQKIRAVTGGELSAANWFDRMVDPSVFGLRTKLGRGLHVVLVRKIREAERHLLALPAYRGMTPVSLGKALGLNEKHGGARPTQTMSTSVHTFGLAIDIEYTANPWVRAPASWAVLRRSAQLVAGANLTHRSAPKYFSALGSDAKKTTGQIWDELKQRNSEVISYLKLGNDPTALSAALQAVQASGTVGLVDAGESLTDAVVKWRKQIRRDREALEGTDFKNHLPAERGFLSLHRDLVVALRDHACLVWGAVDLGPGENGSGDMMHFDARADGAGRALSELSKAFIPSVGHPCLGASKPIGDSATADETGTGESHARTDPETTPDGVKDKIRAQIRQGGTDVAGTLAELRILRPSQMAQLLSDPEIIDILRRALSGSELVAAATQLARGRVGSMARDEIDRVAASPIRHSFGTLAAAMARSQLLGHQEAFDRTGTGTIHGNRCPTQQPPGTTSSDCTEYVKSVLKRTFTAKGQASIWADVLKEATTRSGPGGLKGTEVIRAMQAKQGWEAIFWAPDPRSPADGLAEHSYAYKIVVKKSTYYKIAVDPAMSVINYRRTNPASTNDMSGIERLRRLQFGVLAARGGKHMAIVVNGAVYEVHWESAATDRNAIEATSLENFSWLSGTVAAPPGDLALAWRTP